MSILRRRLALAMTLILVVAAISACYKNAGQNVEPTNRVDLQDIATTQPAPSPTPTESISPTSTLAEPTTPPIEATASPETVAPVATDAPTLVPTTTPADMVDNNPPAATPTPLSDDAGTGPVATATPSEPVIATPGLSDIKPSPTIPPTVDPANRPTPTAIPVEQNPCIHVVQPNDTLYSISQDKGLLLTDLVAANPTLLGGSSATPLQIGWQLRLPGCDDPNEPDSSAADIEVTPDTTIPPEATTASVPGQPVEHVVQAGETIFAIGRQYGVDPARIIAANNLANPNFIRPGDVLIIPPAQ